MRTLYVEGSKACRGEILVVNRRETLYQNANAFFTAVELDADPLGLVTDPHYRCGVCL